MKIEKQANYKIHLDQHELQVLTDFLDRGLAYVREKREIGRISKDDYEELRVKFEAVCSKIMDHA